MLEQKKKKEKSLETVKKTLKYFLPIAWKLHKGYFFASLLRMLINTAQPFVTIFVSPLIIDELLGGRDIKKLILYTAVLVIGNTLLGLSGSLLGIVLEKYDEKFQNHFILDLSKRVMELDFQITEDKKALDKVEAARTGMEWYSGGVHGLISPLFEMAGNILKIAGTVTVIALYAPLLFLVILILVILNALLQSKQNKIEEENFRGLSKLNRAFGYFGWNLTDFRYGKDIRLYDAKDMMVEKWQQYSNDSLAYWKDGADRQHPISHAQNILGVIRDIVSYLYLGILVINGSISIAVFTQMLTACSTLNTEMNNFMYQTLDLVKRCNYAYDFVKFTQFPAAIEKGNLHIDNKPHIIEFKNVSFTYPNTEVKVLNNVSLTLKQGEHLSVVGLNGAGKTTFVKLLCRLYDVTGGEILLDGVNIKEYDYNEYMSLFSPVFQDFKLFDFTIRENIDLEEDCSDSDLNNLMEQVGLKEKIDSLEKGVDTNLFKSFDENGIEPSGGEQQKIAIARALHKKSPVVILDEPTAALDPVAEYDIYRKFSTLVGGKTAIYISHRLSSCKFCDKIAVFSEGTIKEYGTHDELVIINGGIYAEMFKAQAKYYN